MRGGLKVCTRCRCNKPPNAFYERTGGGRMAQCKLCLRESEKKRRSNPGSTDRIGRGPLVMCEFCLRNTNSIDGICTICTEQAYEMMRERIDYYEGGALEFRALEIKRAKDSLACVCTDVRTRIRMKRALEVLNGSQEEAPQEAAELQQDRDGAPQEQRLVCGVG